MMKIGVLMGGISTEREVSLKSGQAAYEYLSESYKDDDSVEIINIVLNSEDDLIEKCKGLDFALLALHGKFGEDGTVQSVLKTLGVKYSGCGPISSGLCMNKDLTKVVLKANNIRTARWLNVSSVEEIDYDKIEEIGYPVFIKPTNGGSSVATFKIYNKEEVENAVAEGLKYDAEVMIEEFIKGDEITCPVFAGEMKPVIAIKPTSDFFDFTQKYAEGGAEEVVVELEEGLHKEVEAMALATYKALKCDVYARIDMIITEEGKPYVLEVNTLPGMTSSSLFPKSMAASGVDFTTFLKMLIEESMKVKR